MLLVLEAMTAGQYLSVQEEHDYLSTSEDLLYSIGNEYSQHLSDGNIASDSKAINLI